jgi:hypothetical protein
MARKLLSEVFDANKKLKTNAEKAAFLKQHVSPAFFYVLWLGFTDKVTWLLPDGHPPFKAWDEIKPGGRQNRPGSEPSDLVRELRRLYLLLSGGEAYRQTLGLGGEHLTQLKREKLFQQVLEGLAMGEVNLLLSLKDKTFSKDYKISRPLLDETFPGILDAPFKLKFIPR